MTIPYILARGPAYQRINMIFFFLAVGPWEVLKGDGNAPIAIKYKNVTGETLCMSLCTYWLSLAGRQSLLAESLINNVFFISQLSDSILHQGGKLWG